eukprot:contig_22809_g5632
METVGQSVTAGSVAAEALDKARGSAGGARAPGESGDALGGKSSPLTVSVVHPSLEDGDGGNSEEDHAYWGVLLSPSGTVVLALRGDGVVTAWALTTALRDGDLARSYAMANASSVTRGGAGDGVFSRVRSGWDVLAAVQAGGHARAANTVRALGNGESTEGLRVGLLSTVDGNAAAVGAARRLLAAALMAVQSSAPPGVLAILESGRTGSGSHGGFLLRNPAHVASVISAEVAKSRTPSSALAAAPLADWVLNLCAVWLRRANQMVLRNSPEVAGLVGPDWVAVDAEDTNVNDSASVVKDARVTKQLRSASVACATLLALDEAFGDRGDVRWERLGSHEAGDIVAAMWDVSSSADQASDNLGRVRALASALARHSVAARALRTHKRLRIEVAERALGLRGSAKGAGYLLSRTRSSPGGAEAVSLDPSDDTAEWCPYDIVTGRPLPPWAPLR